MNNPNTIENRVLRILQECNEARNDDMKLYLMSAMNVISKVKTEMSAHFLLQ